MRNPSQSFVFRERDGFAHHYFQVTSQGIQVSQWDDYPKNDLSTNCFAVDTDYWILRADFGALQFTKNNRDIKLYPAPSADLETFRFWVNHSWLPMVYQVWGTQVLHAGAVAQHSTGEVIAITGDRERGKSTFVFGLGMRKDWQQIADDSFAFRIEDASVHVEYIPNVVRLRPNSAEHFSQEAYSHQELDWPGIPLRLSAIYSLAPEEDERLKPTFTKLSYRQTYTELLKQGFFFSENLPEHNRFAAQDYLTLAREIPVFSLRYSKNFDALEEVLDAIEDHSI